MACFGAGCTFYAFVLINDLDLVALSIGLYTFHVDWDAAHLKLMEKGLKGEVTPILLIRIQWKLRETRALLLKRTPLGAPL